MAPATCTARPRRRRPLVGLVAVLAATAIAACSGDGGRVETTPSSTAAPPPLPTSSTRPATSPPPSPSTTAAPTTLETTPPPTEARSTSGSTGDHERATTGADEPAATAAVDEAGPPSSGAGGAFTFEVSAISPELASRMTPSSWREGCPVALADLRYLRIAHWGFDDAVHVGELVVAADVVDDIGAVFGQLFAAGFPIRRMRLVDDYGGDDFASIEDDNTSAFNCRAATGSSNWSQHAYGRAIDVNPLENPYVSGGATDHPASEPYLDRSPRPGLATEGGVLVAAFDARGWDWGGRWTAPVDYQHFSATGG